MQIRSSLRNALTFHFTIAVVLPVLTMGLLGLHYLTSNLTSSISERNLWLAKNVREELRTLIKEPSSNLAQAGHLIESGLIRSDSEINQLLALTVTQSQFFDSVYLVRNGYLTHLGLKNSLNSRRKDLIGLDLSAQFSEQKFAHGEISIWSDAFMSVITGEPSLTINLPLREAILVGNFSLRQLNAIISRTQTEPGITVSVVDRNGTLIAHHDATLVMQRYNLSQHREIRFGLEGQEGTFTQLDEQGRRLESLVRLPETSWVIRVSQNLDQALTPVYTLRNLLIGIMVLCTITGMCAAFLFSRQLMEPLAALTRNTRRIARGEYDAPLPPSSYSEIEDLASGFRIMAQAVRDREQSLEESRNRFQLLFQGGNDAVYVYLLRADGSFSTFIEVNDVACARLGYAREDLLKMTPAQIVASEMSGEMDYIKQKLLTDSHAIFEILHVARDGRRIPVEVSSRAFPLGDKKAVMAIARDLSERKLAESAIEQLAYYDALTQLPNRLLLEDRAGQAIAQANRDKRIVAVLFLDIDRFKVINDTMGHQAGDQLLREVASRLSGCVRKSDTVARLGGDDFVIILTGVPSSERVSQAARLILERLTPPYTIQEQETYITASIGIALYPHDGNDFEHLLKNADTAMNHAKEQGRNSYQFFAEDMNQRALERLALETSLRRALERNEFLLHYQPINDCATGQVRGMEALLRWEHPDMGLVSPNKFIPLAEETGLILPIGEWVLRRACEQAVRWQKQGHENLLMAVNLSARQLKQASLIQTIRRILDETGMPAHLLKLELTESVVVENTETNIGILRDLENMGLKLAIDDFGTGYSSLSQLRRFPIHELKIDKSFIRDLTIDPEVAAIAEAIIAMAHSLDLQVVAEGVEKNEQVEFLRQRRCDLLQGFIFSRPLTVPAFENLLQENNREMRIAASTH